MFLVRRQPRCPFRLPQKPSTAKPDEFATLPCPLSTKAPLRENISVCPSADFNGKTRRLILRDPEVRGELNALTKFLTNTGDSLSPSTVPAEFCRGLLAKISPNDAFDFLKPVVPTLAMLLLVTASSVFAA